MLKFKKTRLIYNTLNSHKLAQGVPRVFHKPIGYTEVTQGHLGLSIIYDPELAHPGLVAKFTSKTLLTLPSIRKQVFFLYLIQEI